MKKLLIVLLAYAAVFWCLAGCRMSGEQDFAGDFIYRKEPSPTATVTRTNTPAKTPTRTPTAVFTATPTATVTP